MLPGFFGNFGRKFVSLISKVYLFKVNNTNTIKSCEIVTKLTITDFGVHTAILNISDFSRRWCKLNFGLLLGHVKSYDFSERIETRRQYFHFLMQIS